MKTLSITLITLFIGFFTTHSFKIEGTVTDENGLPLPGANVLIQGTSKGTHTNFDGDFSLDVEKGQTVEISYIGYETLTVRIENKKRLKIQMKSSNESLEEVIVTAQGMKKERKSLGYAVSSVRTENIENRTSRDVSRVLSGKSSGVVITQGGGVVGSAKQVVIRGYSSNQIPSQESYARIEENAFKQTHTAPLSTFSIDVDKAGYSNIRRMINNGQRIPKDAVKVEEMINYFSYAYPEPKGKHPFSITTQVANSPWSKEAQLVRIGLKGKDIDVTNAPASNLVFLIDVSGSMDSPKKLGLLQQGFKVLIEQLRDEDKVSIIVYAGAAGQVLPPTSGAEKETLIKAIESLTAGGATAGGEGIKLAYKIAQEQFIKGGNNRVILATDGDFNVGASSDRAMEDLIVEKRKSGVFLTVLGFGMGNYKDSKMETLADKGNGNHAYIDSMQEAKKVLGTEFFGTTYAIAKDVKIQVEFNPAKVQAYRLIGYENRLLNDEDFNDDTKDAGELGSGHTVTALYEIIPVGVSSPYVKDVEPLQYSKQIPSRTTTDLFTVKFRYKEPSSNSSKLLVVTHRKVPQLFSEMDADFKFSAAVALFGQQLRDSDYVGVRDRAAVVAMAEAGRGIDHDGYRAEFIRLVKSYQ